MGHTTRNTTQYMTTTEGGSRDALEAQLLELQAETKALREARYPDRPPPSESKPRVPTFLPKFKGRRGEDVRKWLSQIDKLCRINGHDASNANVTVPSIAGTSMEEPASGWFLFWASRTPAEEQTWGRFTQDALAHFEASNYQAVLRQKLRQLRQVGDIEEYNGKYSSLIFRAEDMSEVDQVGYYCDGLKRATQAYVKLQNATTLSEAMDQAAKYEIPHFGGERKPDREKPERELRFRGKPRSSQSQDKKPFSKHRTSPATTHHWSKLKKDPFALLQEAWKLQAEQDLTVNEATLNLLCEDPLVYNRAPLFSVDGRVFQCERKIEAKSLLDCGATTVYVSRNFVKRNRLKTHAYTGRTIKVKLGDNKIGEAMLELVKIEVQLPGAPNYEGVAVIFDIPDEFDCVLGMPFFVDVQPDIDWKRRCFKIDVSGGDSAMETSTPGGKCSQANGSGLRDAVDSESSSVIGRDSCRAAVPETPLGCEAKAAETPAEDVGKLSWREKKNVRVDAMEETAEVLRLPAKNEPEHDFMVVLSNDTIKEIERDLKRNDEPHNVGSEKAKRFLQTNWESFKDNPAYPIILNGTSNIASM
ncbi:hypothetical protein PC114_g18478 [Phytophthora cactorum]|nr:hypothetical protein PC114_g18478 [Phytophthora cactorum]